MQSTLHLKSFLGLQLIARESCTPALALAVACSASTRQENGFEKKEIWQCM